MKQSVKVKQKKDYHQYLSFLVDNKFYCIDILSVKEIKGYVEAVKLPNTLDFMLGVINIRGSVVPIFDLKARFGAGNNQYDIKKVIIVISVDEQLIGVLVDAVSDILEVDKKEIKHSNAAETAIKEEFIQGMILQGEKEMVAVLDQDKLFCKQALTQLKQMQQE